MLIVDDFFVFVKIKRMAVGVKLFGEVVGYIGFVGYLKLVFV